MLYDNVQFVSLMAKFLRRINPDDYFIKKAKQTTEFLLKDFVSTDTKLLGSAFDADSEGEVEGKYYVFNYNEIKDIKDIKMFFDIKPEGNWEEKIILDEIKLPNKQIINELMKIRKTKKKTFF